MRADVQGSLLRVRRRGARDGAHARECGVRDRTRGTTHEWRDHREHGRLQGDLRGGVLARRGPGCGILPSASGLPRASERVRQDPADVHAARGSSQGPRGTRHARRGSSDSAAVPKVILQGDQRAGHRFVHGPVAGSRRARGERRFRRAFGVVDTLERSRGCGARGRDG